MIKIFSHKKQNWFSHRVFCVILQKLSYRKNEAEKNCCVCVDPNKRLLSGATSFDLHRWRISSNFNTQDAIVSDYRWGGDHCVNGRDLGVSGQNSEGGGQWPRFGGRQGYVYSLVYRVRSTRQKSGSIYHHLGMTSPASLGKNRPSSMETYTPYVHNDKLWCQLALTEIELNRFVIRDV